VIDTPVDAALVWLRRDLRLDDHAALHHALRSAKKVWCAFIFDTTILDALPRADRRVEFIHHGIVELDGLLRAHGSGLIVRHGDPLQEIPAIAGAPGVQAVHINRDYEPAAVARDAQVRGALAHAGIALHSHKDQVIFETDEILTMAGSPFSVFTPYKNAWLKKLDGYYLRAYPVQRHIGALAPVPAALDRGVPTLNDLDFLERIDRYADTRDFPAIKGPSYLSVHLRFGTVSIRQLARLAHERMVGGSRGAEVWLSELIWRDFYHQILHHHPRVVTHCYKPEYEALRWEHGKHAEQLFAAWCEGRTGYPIIDAAMLQLNRTGYMHNRLRMVVASFLTKDLGIDWRRGEAYFALQLNDYDLAANNGGWQWAASTGTDAAPYFRIFNPTTQGERFDPEGEFIRRWVPELAQIPGKAVHQPHEWAIRQQRQIDYPLPMVDHKQARTRTLAAFEAAKNGATA